MSKVLDHAAYLKPDPNNTERSIFTIEISISNDVIDQDGIEIVAQANGWQGEGSPCQYVIDWVKSHARNSFKLLADLQAEAVRRAVLEQISQVV